MTEASGRVGAGFAGAVALGLLVVVIASSQTGPAGGVGPLTDDTVVAVLQGGDRAMPPNLLQALKASRTAPDDATLAKRAARALIAEGRLQGDSRLVGAAIGVLRRLSPTRDAEVYYLEATARQYQHDFDGALALLDRAHDLDPRAVNVLLTRATIKIVQGRLGDAQVDCRAISALQRPEIGFLCQATALLLSAEAPAIAARLADIVASPGLLDDGLRGWAIGLMAETALLQGDDATARRHLETVLADDPTALRERLLLADLLLRQGEAAAVTALLRDAPPIDGVLVRRVLAAQASGDDAAEDRAELSARVRQNLDIGLTAHAREETMYFLHIARDPAMALARAKVNWALQHEIEDGQLLIDAAVAAGQPSAAQPVLDWIAAEGVVVPALRLPDPGR